jgi:hypothetical protein
MKVIRFLLDLFGWLIIVFGTTAGSALVPWFIYSKWTTDTVGIISIIIISLGFLFGAIWATKIWIKYGTIEWLSSIRRIS